MTTNTTATMIKRIMAHVLVIVISISTFFVMTISASAEGISYKGERKAIYSGINSAEFVVITGTSDSTISFTTTKGQWLDKNKGHGKGKIPSFIHAMTLR